MAHDLESRLRRWGWWKRNSILSVGATGTIEQKIKEQLPFGDGCVGGGFPIETINNLKLLRPSEDVEEVQKIVLSLMDVRRREAWVLQCVYVFEWSLRHVAGSVGVSRPTIKSVLRRAKGLIGAQLGIEDDEEGR